MIDEIRLLEKMRSMLLYARARKTVPIMPDAGVAKRIPCGLALLFSLVRGITAKGRKIPDFHLIEFEAAAGVFLLAAAPLGHMSIFRKGVF